MNIVEMTSGSMFLLLYMPLIMIFATLFIRDNIRIRREYHYYYMRKKSTLKEMK